MTLRIKLTHWPIVAFLIGLCFLFGGNKLNAKPAILAKRALAAPGLTLSPGALTGFTTEQGKPSAPQAYTILSTDLTDSIRITASAGFEISPNGTFYSNSITLAPSTSFAVIIVRMTGLTVGSIAGSITHTSTGLLPRTLSVLGTVTRFTGITPIADARRLGDDIYALIQGTVTVNKQFNDGQLLYLQDRTGGIALFVPATDVGLYPLFQTRTIQVGNEIQVRGIRTYQKGIVGLSGIISLSIVNATTVVPTPKVITAAQMADAENQGLLVRIDSSSITDTRPAFVAETDIRFVDAAQSPAILRVKTGVNDLVNSLKPTPKTNLTGIVDGYDLDNDIDNGLEGLRLYPRSQADIPGTTELVQRDGGVANRTQTLDIAAWNVDSLGAALQGPPLSGLNDALQQANVSSVIRYLNADLLTISGVSSPEALSTIAATISQTTSQTYVAVCPEGGYYQGTNPRVCFLYKSTLFVTPPSFSVISTGLVAADWDGGRFPVMLSGDVTLNGLSRRLTFVGVHAHDGPTITDYMIRQRASTQLKTYLDSRGTESFIISGDFGDDVDASVATPNQSPYDNFVNAPTSYSAITKALSDTRLATSLTSDNVTSHILVSNELFANYLPGTVNTISPDALVPTYLADVADWGISTSEHLPVFARFSLATPGSLTATLAGSSTICGETTAPLRLTIVGGVSPYQVVVSNGTSTSTVSNYISGTVLPISLTSTTSYSLVSVTDALSITAGTMSGTATVTVIPNARPVSLTITPASASFCQGRTVLLTSTVGSGQLPLTYRWSTGAQTPTISATVTGNYQLTVLDGLGCSASTSLSTTVNTIPDLTTFGASATALCTGGSQVTTFSANVGTIPTPYSYTLGSSLGSVSGFIPIAGTFSQLVAINNPAAYTLTVATPQGCTASATQSISLNATPSIFSLRATPSCAGRPSTFTALVSGLTGMYNYTLTNGLSDQFGTGNGTIPFSAVLVPSTTNTYSLIVANQNCVATANTQVQVGTSAPIVSLVTTNTLLTCSQTTATLIASGGVNYAFSPINGGVLTNTTGTLAVNQPGNYAVLVTDLYGCTATANTIILANTTVPIATLTPTNSILTCTNRTSSLIASGGSFYSFYNPAGILLQSSQLNTLAVNAAGTYSVVVTAPGGCTATASALITANNSIPTVGLTAGSQLSCSQPKVILTAVHTEIASSYKFTNLSVPGSAVVFSTAPQVEVTVAGYYQVEVAFANGCVGLGYATVQSSASIPGVSLSASGQVTCSQPTIRLTAIHTETATRYEFTNPSGITTLVTAPSNSVTANAPGTYTVKVIFQNGCSNTASVVVTQSTESPTVLLQSSGQLSCSQPRVTLTAVHTGNATGYVFTGAGNYRSSSAPPKNTAEVTAAGTYLVEVTFSSGCVAYAQATVTNQTTPISAFITGNTTVCSGVSTILTVNAPSDATFRWASGEITQSISAKPNVTTTYTVTVTQGTCSAIATATVFVTTCVPLVLTAPTYNCTSGQFLFRSTGGDGSPVEYMSIGITGWTTNAGPYTVKPAADAGPFLLLARTTANPNTVVSYTWDWQAVCGVTTPPSTTTTTPPSSTTTTPPSSTTTATNLCASPTNTIGQTFQLIAPIYNCQTGAIQFRTTGGNGTRIEYMSIGIMGWSTNCQSFIDDATIVANIRNQSPPVSPFTLLARQNGVTVSYSWDAQKSCASGGRLATEPGSELMVTVLGNPTLSEEVEVEISGAAGNSITLRVADAQGNIIANRQINKANTTERQTIKLGRGVGLYLLQVSSGTQVKTVKILRQ